MAHYIFSALFLFSPLVIWNTLPYPHAFPRYIWMTTVCTTWIIYIVAKRRSLILTRIDAAFFLFIIALGASTLLSTDPWFSLWGSIERSFAFSLWIFLACAYFGLKVVWVEKKSVEIIGKTSIVVLFLMSLWGIAQALIPGFATTFSGGRIGGTLGNAIFFAMYLSLSLWWVIFLLTTEFFRTSRLWKYLAVTTITLALLTFTLTQSTGALLGLLAGIGVGAKLWAYHKTKRTLVIALAMVAAILAVYGAIYAINNKLYKTTTTEIRLIHWKIALQGFAARPLIGFGYEQYRAAADTFFSPQLTNFSLAETYADKPHSTQLELLVTTGLLGTLTYLLFITTVFITLWQLKKNNQLNTQQCIILISLLVTREIQNLSAFETHGTVVMLILIISFISHREELLQNQKKYSSRKLAIACGVCALPLFIYGTVMPYQTIAHLDTKITAEKINNTPFTSDAFTAYSHRIVGQYWQRSDLVARWSPEERAMWNQQAAALRATIDQLATHYSNNAAWQLKLSHSAFQLFTITNIQEDGTRALTLLTRTHELTPQREEPFLLMTQVYLQQNSTASALTAIDSAISINPQLSMGHWYRGLILYQAQDPHAAWLSTRRALELDFDAVNQTVANYIYNKLLTANMTAEAAEFAQRINR